MTPAQSKVFDFVVWYWEQYDCAPSYDNIKDHCGVASKSGVHRLVKSLLNKGYLRKEPGGARCLVPVEKVDASQELYAAALQVLSEWHYTERGRQEGHSALLRAIRRIEKRKGLANGFDHSRGGSLHQEPAGIRLNHHGNIR